MKNENETVLKTNEGRVKTDNELIAEFMGGFKNDNGTWRLPSYPDHKKDLCYDVSWDWLMPVVSGINEGWEAYANKNRIEVNSINAMPDSLVRIRINLPRVDIFIIHRSVVEFIKWYNERGG